MSPDTERRELIRPDATIAYWVSGPDRAPVVVLLHGATLDHHAWDAQVEELAARFRVVVPDLRGYGASDKPEGVEQYGADRIVEDLIALADALEIGRFTLVGHDWGGAVSWLAALRHPDRIGRLVLVNAPHPLIFQKSLIDDPAQREASQYIRVLRSPAAEAAITGMGLETFLDRVMLAHADATKLPAEERQHYLDDWSQPGALTAMLNWYRASKMVVPEPGEEAKAPLWTNAPFPKLKMPVLVVWGLKDTALLPVQLEGLHDLIDDLRLVTSPSAGHFITWEEPGVVTRAIEEFMTEAA